MLVLNIQLIIGVSYIIFNKYLSYTNNVAKKVAKYYNYCIANFANYDSKYITMDKNYTIREQKIDNILDNIFQFDFDYMIYVSNNNYTIYNDISKIDIDSVMLNTFSSYKNKSLVNFSNIILLYETTEYEIIFDDNNNYYIEDNILFNDKFMIFYCKHYLNLDIDLKKNYTIMILVNFCEIIELHNNKYIQINATDYTIIDNVKVTDYTIIDNVKALETIQEVDDIDEIEEVEVIQEVKEIRFNWYNIFF